MKVSIQEQLLSSCLKLILFHTVEIPGEEHSLKKERILKKSGSQINVQDIILKIIHNQKL